MKRHAVLLVGAGVLAALAAITWDGSLDPARAFQQAVMGAFLALLYLANRTSSAPDRPLDRQLEVAWGEFALCVAVGFAAAALWVHAHPLAIPRCSRGRRRSATGCSAADQGSRATSLAPEAALPRRDRLRATTAAQRMSFGADGAAAATYSCRSATVGFASSRCKARPRDTTHRASSK